MFWEEINKLSFNILLGLMFFLGFAVGVFTTHLVYHFMIEPEVRVFYKNPELLTKQSKVLESCMEGYDRTLKLLGEANGLLDKLTQ